MLYLYYERKRRNLTALQVADCIGVSTCYIYQIEHGRKKPSYRVVTALEQYYSLPHYILFNDCVSISNSTIQYNTIDYTMSNKGDF